MRREITDVWLRGLTPPESGRLEVWDTRAPGLVLRIGKKGVAIWSVRARTAAGKRTRPKIGSWPSLSIADARKRARAITAAIDGGGDPVKEKRAAQAARKAALASPTVAEKLVEWQAMKIGSWSERYQREVKRVCDREITPKLGKRPLAETTRAEWVSVISAVHRRTRGVGATLYRAASAFLNHAEVHSWIEVALLPRKGLSAIAPPPPSRERTLTDEELKSVWLAAKALKPKARAFVHLLIMTAAREMEAADIAIGEIDLEGATWSIPGERTKNGLGITLPLHDLLMVDLRAVWPAHGERAGDTWRLLGNIAGNGLRGFSKTKTRIDSASGVSGWRWHDLRRTARTGLTRLGVPRDHAEAAINHVSDRSQLERTYDRHDFAPEVIAALQRWQAHVAALVAGEAGGAEIVQLRRQA
jgi:integrase